MPLKQHPFAHWLPAQQGSPVLPHTWQIAEVEVEVDEQTVPEAQRSVPLAPVQHCSPASPQDEQTPLRHARPEPQVVPQQGWPAAPQPAHLPAPQTPGPAPPLPPVPSAEPPQVVPSDTHISL
jgi:hypothetical protein